VAPAHSTATSAPTNLTISRTNSAVKRPEDITTGRFDNGGGFSSQKVISNQVGGAYHVLAADLTGNGQLDVVSGTDEDELWWFEHTDTGFTDETVLGSGKTGAHEVGIEDLDGDGNFDILGASVDNPALTWRENHKNQFSSDSGLADAPWPRMGRDLQTTGRSSNAGPEQAEMKWSFDAGSRVQDPSIGSDGTIYVGDADGLHAVESSGTEKWSYSGAVSGGENRDNVNDAPAIAEGGSLYFGSDADYAHAVGLDGQRQWVERVCSQCNIASSPAVVSDGTMYIGTNDGELYAFNPDGSVKWKFDAGGRVMSPAVASDGTIYVGSGDLDFQDDVSPSEVFAINPDGSVKWSTTVGGQVKGDPTIGPDGTVYVGAIDGKVYAINLDGTQQWSYDTGGAVRSSSAIAADGTIYVGSNSDAVHAINPDGSQKWKYETGGNVRSSPAVGGEGRIYVGSRDSMLYAFNPDGTVAWQKDLGASVRSSPAIGSNGRIYVGAGSKLYAIGESNDDSVGTIADEFNDGTFEDKWRITEQDDETIQETNGHLRHESPKNYNNGGNMVSRSQAAATGTVTLTIRQRQEQSDYWGTGIRVRFDDGTIRLKEHKWRDNDALRLKVRGENVEEKEKKLASPTSSTSWLTYRLTLDFSTETITSVRRGEDTYDVSVDFSGISGDTYRVELGGGRGHDTLYDYLRTEGGETNPPIAPVSDTTRQAGSEFWVDIKVGSEERPVQDLFGNSFTLDYDESALTVTGDEAGSFLGNDLVYSANDDAEAGEIGIGVSRKSSAGGASGSGVVARVKFQVGEDVESGASLPFDLKEVQANDPDDNSITLSPKPLEVIVKQGLTVWPGDTNNDGTVDQADVLPLGQHWDATGPAREEETCEWAGHAAQPFSPEAATYADANGDGAVDQADLLCIGQNWGSTHDTGSEAALASGSRSEGGSHQGSVQIQRAEASGPAVWYELQAEGTGPMTGASTEVTYPAGQAEVLEVRPGPAMGEAALFESRVEEEEGTIALGASRTEGTVPGGTVFARVKMRLEEGASRENPVAVREATAGLPSGQLASLKGSAAPVAVEELSLQPPSPNPVRSEAEVQYTLPEAREVQLTLYNALGQKVQALVAGQQEAGRHAVRLDASKLASGLYLVRLRAGESAETRKVTIVR